MFFDINMWEGVLILGIAVLLIGPRDLARYVSTVKNYLRDLKNMAEGAKEQFKADLGPEFTETDWRAYDPRTYNPRNILRDALAEEPKGVTSATTNPPPMSAVAVESPFVGTPYDTDAT